MTRSCSHLKALPALCIVGALVASARRPRRRKTLRLLLRRVPSANEQCEQAQQDAASLRGALAEANNQVSAKASRVTALKRAFNRTSSKRKRRQLKRKLTGARKSLSTAKARAEEIRAQLTAARETLGQC